MTEVKTPVEGTVVPPAEEPTPAQPAKTDWANECAISNGQMIMCPEELKADVAELKKVEEEAVLKSQEFNKINAKFQNLSSNVFYKFRMMQDEAGNKIVYDKNIRFNFDARADGEDVFMLTNPQQ